MWGARVAMMNGFPRSTLYPKEGEVALSAQEALKGNLTLTQSLSESRLLSCAERCGAEMLSSSRCLSAPEPGVLREAQPAANETQALLPVSVLLWSMAFLPKCD